MSPRVSVVIPCYNYGDLLPEAVCSVLVQSYRDWELIIVNDGSEDDTAEVAQRLIDQYPLLRIRLVDKPNGGVSDARNAGIAASCGCYILPLDADDGLHPSMLDKAVNLLDGNPDIAVLYTDLYCIGEPRPGQVMRLPDYSKELIVGGHYTYSCIMYRREVWETVGGYDSELVALEDWDFWLGCIEHGFEVRRIPQALWGVRVKREGLHTQVLANDLVLRARVTYNHPKLFNDVTLAWAEAVLAPASDPDSRIPNEIMARSDLTNWLCAAHPANQQSIVELQDEIRRLQRRLSTCSCGASVNGDRARLRWFGRTNSR